MTRIAAGVIAILVLLGLAAGAHADARVALVIGNSDYAHGARLANPANDAIAVGQALRQVGFKVTSAANLNKAQLEDALKGFARDASGADVAVIYFAGHGMEMGGTNYLIPVDATLATSSDVDFETVPLALALRSVEGARRLKLVILDACRDNPFLVSMQRVGGGRSIGRGLARVEPSGDMLVAYASSEGSIAADGSGGNSPFATALARRMTTPGLEIRLLFGQVRDDVLAATGQRQEPAIYGSLGGEAFYFLPPSSTPATASSGPPAPPVISAPPPDSRTVELAFWDSIRSSTNPADYQAYLTQYPTGVFAAIARNRLTPAAPTPEPAPPPVVARGRPNAPQDYGDRGSWLCWPGRIDLCAADLTTTVIRADGSTSLETFRPNPNAPIDCFFVYPSLGPGDPDADGAQDTSLVVAAASRLGAKCRLYVPVYHPRPSAQVASLDALGVGGPLREVREAWSYYLTHENHGRGVVVFSQGQGAGVAIQLVKRDIDGQDSQKLLVSVILAGADLAAPPGRSQGGDFSRIPMCRSSSQIGCAVAYASYRETSPPGDDARFGRARQESGLAAACVNPANVGGSGPGEAKSYLRVAAAGSGAYPWLRGRSIDTLFVSLPGLISARCVASGPFTYLSVHINADPRSPRATDIPGEVIQVSSVQPAWGLHLVDANLFMGNLVDLVGAQADAWKQKSSPWEKPAITFQFDFGRHHDYHGGHH